MVLCIVVSRGVKSRKQMKTRSSTSNFRLNIFNTNVKQLSYLNVSFSANFPPKILGPEVINATVGQAIEVKITAEHNSSDFFVFTVNNLPDVIILANTSRYLLIRWTPTSLQKVCAHMFISVNQHHLLCQRFLADKVEVCIFHGCEVNLDDGF